VAVVLLVVMVPAFIWLSRLPSKQDTDERQSVRDRAADACADLRADGAGFPEVTAAVEAFEEDKQLVLSVAARQAESQLQGGSSSPNIISDLANECGDVYEPKSAASGATDSSRPAPVRSRDDDGCAPPRLLPSELPANARKVDLDPYISGLTNDSWGLGDGFLEVSGGVFSTTEIVSISTSRVRNLEAVVGHLEVEGDPDAAPTVVAWTERTRCGPVRYAVSSNVLDAASVIAIADGLAPAS
jgi:hypothetical protein